MKNRIVGFLIIGIAALIGFIIYSFNTAMTDIVGLACSHGPECAMWQTIDFQTNTSIGIMAFIIVIGLYLIFFGKEEKIVTRIKTVKQQIDPQKITRANYQRTLSKLPEDEKLVFEILIDSKGSILQSEVVTKANMSKVKVTRVLDRLEGKKLIERKRRGMTNVIILKQ